MSPSYLTSAELSRVMVPADANVAGNVHGGTIMQLIEEAAGVAAHRFFNSGDNTPNKVIEVLSARVESLTFQQPLHVGDVAKVKARVVFASEHTVAVAVKLLAERPTFSKDGNRADVGNQSLVWVVGMTLDGDEQETSFHKDSLGIATVQRAYDPSKFVRAKAPPLEPPTDNEGSMAHKLASMAYQRRKTSSDDHLSDRASLPGVTATNDSTGSKDAGFAPDQSAVELVQVMLPADCVTGSGLVRGGVVMKLMDNASGVAAVRHCGTNVVTVSVDAMDLAAPVLVGDVLRIKAQATFASSKSMEIEVTVLAERFTPDHDGRLTRQEIVTTKQAFFTFVSLGSSGRPLPMRPLVATTDEDKKRFVAGQARYEQRKALRASVSQKDK